jgi:hypothetical protein
MCFSFYPSIYTAYDAKIKQLFFSSTDACADVLEFVEEKPSIVDTMYSVLFFFASRHGAMDVNILFLCHENKLTM